jgi:membrane protease YdiL (CAAX protease family)
VSSLRTSLSSTSDDADSSKTVQPEIINDLQNIGTLVGAQTLLVPISIFVANMLRLPNRGLGSGFILNSAATIQGIQWTIPLFVIAGIMRVIEPYSPALQDVTKATQRSVLAVMGSRRRPVFALLVSILLGAVAGWGEEWLFRGVFQTSMSRLFGEGIALGVSG